MRENPYPDELEGFTIPEGTRWVYRREMAGGKIPIEKRPDGTYWLKTCKPYDGAPVAWINMAHIEAYEELEKENV
jgi:hypothetical protein